jgi:hypothetical protein
MQAALQDNMAAAQKTLDLAQQGLNRAGNPISSDQAANVVKAMQNRISNIQQTLKTGVQAPKN